MLHVDGISVYWSSNTQRHKLPKDPSREVSRDSVRSDPLNTISATQRLIKEVLTQSCSERSINSLTTTEDMSANCAVF
jgi:hypothetical protein